MECFDDNRFDFFQCQIFSKEEPNASTEISEQNMQHQLKKQPRLKGMKENSIKKHRLVKNMGIDD